MRESASPLEEIGPPGPPGHDSDGIHASAAEFHGGPFEMAPSRRRTPRSDPRSGRSRERPVRRLLAHWPHLRWLVRSLDSPGRRSVRASLQAALRRPLLGRGRQPPRPALHLLPNVERSRRLRVDPSPCRLGRRNPASAGQCRRGMWLRVQSAHPRGEAYSGTRWSRRRDHYGPPHVRADAAGEGHLAPGHRIVYRPGARCCSGAVGVRQHRTRHGHWRGIRPGCRRHRSWSASRARSRRSGLVGTVTKDLVDRMSQAS